MKTKFLEPCDRRGVAGSRAGAPHAASTEAEPCPRPGRIEGVVVGTLLTLAEGVPLVASPVTGGPLRVVLSTVALSKEHVGRRVALVFEGGNPSRPVVMGLIHEPTVGEAPERPLPSVSLDGERLLLSAEKEIELRCGEASIILTRAGKVLVRGAYIVSRSTGPHHIKGASVSIN